MIPPNQGSSLFQDSSLNRKPSENFYILGYQSPTEIYQYVTKREHTVHSVLEYLDPEDETMTNGSPYNFSMLNSPETDHIGKKIISTNW